MVAASNRARGALPAGDDAVVSSPTAWDANATAVTPMPDGPDAATPHCATKAVTANQLLVRCTTGVVQTHRLHNLPVLARRGARAVTIP